MISIKPKGPNLIYSKNYKNESEKDKRMKSIFSIALLLSFIKVQANSKKFHIGTLLTVATGRNYALRTPKNNPYYLWKHLGMDCHGLERSKLQCQNFVRALHQQNPILTKMSVTSIDANIQSWDDLYQLFDHLQNLYRFNGYVLVRNDGKITLLTR
jgi:hypothetical protein